MITRSSMLLVLLAFAATSTAQTPAPAAQPAPAPARMAGDANPSSLDPRVCLEFPTTAQVIACAERYRPRRAAAKTAG